MDHVSRPCPSSWEDIAYSNGRTHHIWSTWPLVGPFFFLCAPCPWLRPLDARATFSSSFTYFFPLLLPLMELFRKACLNSSCCNSTHIFIPGYEYSSHSMEYDNRDSCSWMAIRPGLVKNCYLPGPVWANKRTGVQFKPIIWAINQRIKVFRSFLQGWFTEWWR